jgi:hypothetical protein
MEFILSLSNLLIDLKLNYILICKELCVSFVFSIFKFTPFLAIFVCRGVKEPILSGYCLSGISSFKEQ